MGHKVKEKRMGNFSKTLGKEQEFLTKNLPHY
jgi:hypothetical protein